jgi:hypothetical protein
MAGIVLEINVDDKGTVKVKQFTDETKKAFEEMKKGPAEARGSLDSLRDSWVGVTAKVAIATGAFYAAKRLIYDTAKEIASATNDIERQAAVLGISTDEFQKWQYAAKMSDVNAQELAIGLKLLSQNMENASSESGDAAKYFSAMGISVKTIEGHLRPLNQVMGDVMDKFARWEDGPRKIAIAMQLFGRSGEALIPLLNKGRSGFQEMAAEAQKLGIILSPEIVKKGGEAEDIFKKLEARLKATKESFAPAALESAKAADSILDDLNRVNSWLKANKTTDWFPQLKEINAWFKANPIDKWLYGAGITTAAYGKKLDEMEMIRETAEHYRNKAVGKVKPPEAPKIDRDQIRNTILEYHKLLAEVDKLSEAGKMPSWEDSLWSYPKQTLPDVIALNLEFNKVLANAELLSQAGEMPDWRESLEIIPKGFAKIEGQLYRLQEIYDSYNVEAPQWVKDWVANWKTPAEQIEAVWTTLGENISSAWNFNVTGILRGTEKIGNAFKNMANGMVDAFISSVTKMIAQWLLFGSITGKTESGGGSLYGGLWSGIIGSIFNAQEGAAFWANKPTLLAVGEGGKSEFVSVTPADKMGKTPSQGGGGNIYNIDARGAQRGVSAEIMRAIRESENRAVIRSVNQVADNKMRGGRFAKIFES